MPQTGGGGGPQVPKGVGKGLHGQAGWWVLKNPYYIATAGLAGKGEYIIEQSVNRPTPTAGVTVAAGPFDTQAEAQAWASSHSSLIGKITNPLDGLVSIGNFFSSLGQANTWIRIAEGVLGIALIIIGLAKLASGTAVGKTAAKVGKAAAIL